MLSVLARRHLSIHHPHFANVASFRAQLYRGLALGTNLGDKLSAEVWTYPICAFDSFGNWYIYFYCFNKDITPERGQIKEMRLSRRETIRKFFPLSSITAHYNRKALREVVEL